LLFIASLLSLAPDFDRRDAIERGRVEVTSVALIDGERDRKIPDRWAEGRWEYAYC
jgi:hypothetical protein